MENVQITGTSSTNVINNLSSVQTKTSNDFAEQLAKSTEKAQASADDAKLKKTCKDMEAMFLNMMMTDMRKTIQKSKLVESSKEDIMTSMLDTEVTKNMANAGGMGLGDMLYRQLRVTNTAVKTNQAPQ